MINIACHVDNRWYWGIESAAMTFTSPAGGYVRVDKRKLGALTEDQCNLVWDLYERAAASDSAIHDQQIELTLDEMKELVKIGKVAGSVYIKKSK
jgi:hypothetical protein